MVRNLSLAAALLATTSALAAMPDNPIAQPGDPARWYEPADTPAKKYALAMKEASAALKESLAECRQAAEPDRKACEGEARANYRADVASAKRLRSGPVETTG